MTCVTLQLCELQEHQTQVVSWEECLGTYQPKPAYVRIPEDLLVLIMTCVCVRQCDCERGHGNSGGTHGITPGKAVTGKPPCTMQADTSAQ